MAQLCPKKPPKHEHPQSLMRPIQLLDGLGEGSKTQNSLFLRNPRSVGCLGAGRRVCGFLRALFHLQLEREFLTRRSL